MGGRSNQDQSPPPGGAIGDTTRSPNDAERCALCHMCDTVQARIGNVPNRERIETMSNAITLVTAKLALGSSLALGLLLSPHAHADDTVINAYEDEGIVHVNLSELPSIDTLPVCTMEDGSDVPTALLPCVWTNQGTAWLTWADHSLPIWDDTTLLG